MNTITRALAALATITLLSVDDIEERQNVDKPKNISAVDWALYNQHAAKTLAEISGMPAPEPGVLDLAPYEIEMRVLHDDPIDELILAVQRAAAELEGQGEKSDRIAAQLITALARFSTETGRP